MWTIRVLNQSSFISHDELLQYLDAQQQQISHHFAPVWKIQAQVIFSKEKRSGDPWIAILDDANHANTLGYHTIGKAGRPYGLVFAKTSLNAGFSWQSTASHEILEMLVDPYANLGALGITPMKKKAYFDYEICDPVENYLYRIGNVDLSNFVFPSWFMAYNVSPKPDKYDFMNVLSASNTIASGGYMTWTLTGNTISKFNKTPKNNPHPKELTAQQKIYISKFFEEQRFGRFSRTAARHGTEKSKELFKTNFVGLNANK